MQYRDRKSGQMRLRLAYMGKIAGLALIQASVSAIGLLLTNIVWNKWQSCNIEVANKTVIYRTGLWEKCIDELVLAKSTCTPLEAEHAAGKVSFIQFNISFYLGPRLLWPSRNMLQLMMIQVESELTVDTPI